MSEQQRFDFLVNRDGLPAALGFALQVHQSYRAAVLHSRKRGFPHPHHGSLREYRRGFIESYLFYKKILFKYTNLPERVDGKHERIQ